VVPAAVQTDPVRGIALLDVVREGPTPRPDTESESTDVDADPDPTLDVGDSTTLQIGQQLVVVAAPRQPGVVVRYVGRAETQIADLGLIQYVLNLALLTNRTLDRGMVLDGQGRLVGIIVPERQAGAAPGHVFAVPVEQARPLLERMGLVRPVPTPIPTPTVTPRPFRTEGG
jgi:S1-C subfamily serine protease